MAKFKTNMTAKDYQKTYDDLQTDYKIVKIKIANRLQVLANEHPQAPVQMMGDTIIKAKTIANIRDINVIETQNQIKMISSIEKWLADQHPHQQLELYK